MNQKQRKLLTIYIASFIVVLVSVVFFAPVFYTKLLLPIYKHCRYLEDRGQFEIELVEYLNSYYQKYERYPDNLDLSQFSAYNNHEYREIMQKIQYSTDNNTFKIVWKFPSSLLKKRSPLLIWTVEGRNGKRTRWDYENVNVK